MAVRYGSIGVASTRTIPPAPVVPGGAGATHAEWVDVDLNVTGGTPDSFHPMMQTTADLSNWIFSNPSAGVLRIYNNSRDDCHWQSNTQTGPILMLKDQIVPRTFTNPAGVTGNQWRAEDALLMIEMTIGAAGFNNDKTGNYGECLGVGPIVVWMTNDQGSGATLVTNNPKPPYDNSGGGYGGSSYYHARISKRNADANHDWHGTTAGGGASGGGFSSDWNPVLTSAAGSVGQPNTLMISNGPRYDASTSDKQGTFAASLFDNRVTNGSVHLFNASGQGHMQHKYDGNTKSEGKYTYIGIAIQNWNNGLPSDGTYLDVTRFRYLVQPLRNRSL